MEWKVRSLRAKKQTTSLPSRLGPLPAPAATHTCLPPRRRDFEPPAQAIAATVEEVTRGLYVRAPSFRRATCERHRHLLFCCVLSLLLDFFPFFCLEPSREVAGLTAPRHLPLLYRRAGFKAAAGVALVGVKMEKASAGECVKVGEREGTDRHTKVVASLDRVSYSEWFRFRWFRVY